jgi:hypothetical protein
MILCDKFFTKAILSFKGLHLVKPGSLPWVSLIFFLLFFHTSILAQHDSTLVPNGDFEEWGNSTGDSPLNWSSNSCCVCVPACDRCIIIRDSHSQYHGQYSLEMKARGCGPATIQIKFPLTRHPVFLTLYIKKHDITDSACISIKLYNKGIVVDTGSCVDENSLDSFTRITVPITNYGKSIDSAEIKMRFGNYSFPFHHTTHYSEIPIMNIDYMWLHY